MPSKSATHSIWNIWKSAASLVLRHKVTSALLGFAALHEIGLQTLSTERNLVTKALTLDVQNLPANCAISVLDYHTFVIMEHTLGFKYPMNVIERVLPQGKNGSVIVEGYMQYEDKISFSPSSKHAISVDPKTIIAHRATNQPCTYQQPEADKKIIRQAQENDESARHRAEDDDKQSIHQASVNPSKLPVNLRSDIGDTKTLLALNRVLPEGGPKKIEITQETPDEERKYLPVPLTREETFRYIGNTLSTQSGPFKNAPIKFILSTTDRAYRFVLVCAHINDGHRPEGADCYPTNPEKTKYLFVSSMEKFSPDVVNYINQAIFSARESGTILFESMEIVTRGVEEPYSFPFKNSKNPAKDLESNLPDFFQRAWTTSTTRILNADPELVSLSVTMHGVINEGKRRSVKRTRIQVTCQSTLDPKRDDLKISHCVAGMSFLRPHRTLHN